MKSDLPDESLISTLCWTLASSLSNLIWNVLSAGAVISVVVKATFWAFTSTTVVPAGTEAAGVGLPPVLAKAFVQQSGNGVALGRRLVVRDRPSP